MIAGELEKKISQNSNEPEQKLLFLKLNQQTKMELTLQTLQTLQQEQEQEPKLELEIELTGHPPMAANTDNTLVAANTDKTLEITIDNARNPLKSNSEIELSDHDGSNICFTDNSDSEEMQLDEKDNNSKELDLDFDQDMNEPLVTKNEILFGLPPVIDFDINTLPEDVEFSKIGVINGIVGCNIVVRSTESGQEKIIECDSVFFVDKPLEIQNAVDDQEMELGEIQSALSTKITLGRVWDVFGPVPEPYYSLRFNSELDAQNIYQMVEGSKGNVVVYHIRDLSKVIMTHPLKVMKGTDASNIWDEEVAADEQDFSDDEKEQQAKKSLKRKKSQVTNPESKSVKVAALSNAGQKFVSHKGKQIQNQDQNDGNFSNSNSMKIQLQTKSLPYPEFNKRIQIQRQNGLSMPPLNISEYIIPSSSESAVPAPTILPTRFPLNESSESPKSDPITNVLPVLPRPISITKPVSVLPQAVPITKPVSVLPQAVPITKPVSVLPQPTAILRKPPLVLPQPVPITKSLSVLPEPIPVTKMKPVIAQPVTKAVLAQPVQVISVSPEPSKSVENVLKTLPVTKSSTKNIDKMQMQHYDLDLNAARERRNIMLKFQQDTALVLKDLEPEKGKKRKI